MAIDAIGAPEGSVRRSLAGDRDLLMTADHPDPGRTVQIEEIGVTRERLRL
jgi:hypothetical protein